MTGGEMIRVLMAETVDGQATYDDKMRLGPGWWRIVGHLEPTLVWINDHVDHEAVTARLSFAEAG